MNCIFWAQSFTIWACPRNLLATTGSKSTAPTLPPHFLASQGYSDRKIAVVWDAIALHTTLGIPQRKQPEIALVQLGAGIDIGAIPRSLVTPESVEIILAEYPRIGFKMAMLAAMGTVIRRKPLTGAVNLMGEVARDHEHLPIPGFCDIVMHADFDD